MTHRNLELSLRRKLNRIEISLAHRFGWSSGIGMPHHVMIEPTSHCNLQCPLCPTGNGTIERARGFMAIENYLKLIEEIQPYVSQVELYSYGESFLHPQIFQMISLAKQRGMRVQISTNGFVFRREEWIWQLVESNLDYLRVGMDGMTQESYTAFRRGGRLDIVQEGLRKLNDFKQIKQSILPEVEIQFIVIRQNENEIETVKTFARQVNAKLRLKSVGLPDLAIQPEYEDWLPTDLQYSRYDRNTSGHPQLVAGKTKGFICYQPWKNLVINWDGTTAPCCYDANGKHSYGNVIQNGVKNSWTSKAASNFRTNHLEGKITMCSKCPIYLWHTRRYSTIAS